MDTKSTPSDLISPEAARLIWADLLPDPPETGTALLRRTERGTGPPCHLVDGPGTGKRMYDAAEVTRWCIRQQPAFVRLLLGLRSGATELVIMEPDPETKGRHWERPATADYFPGPRAVVRVFYAAEGGAL